MTTDGHGPIRVGRVGDIPAGTTKKFVLRIGGSDEECFVVNHGGAFFAYVNRCCHVPITLDWVENRILSDDKRYLVCATHGACYLPDSGECVGGPPLGQFLTRIPLVVRDEEVFVDEAFASPT